MAEELFDVCDEHDRVIGQAPRSEVHARGLLHRAVHIWVWNSMSELMIHLRSDSKDEYPGCFTSSASGHLQPGESYEAAAHRELMEELRLQGSLGYLGKLPAGPETANEHTVLYSMVTDEAPDPDPEEIASCHYFAPDVIREMLGRSPASFTPPFRELFAWWDAQGRAI